MQKLRPRRWTNEERDYVRDNYRRCRSSVQSIAQHLNRTSTSVLSQIPKLAITNGRPNYKEWSEKELNTLHEYYGELPMWKLEDMFGRSASAIHNKAYKVGIKRCLRSDWYTVDDVRLICAVAQRTITGWIKNGQLLATSEVNREFGNVRIHRISKEALRDFIRRYPTELQGRNVDMIQLVEILTGVAYDNPCSGNELPLPDNCNLN
jgi:hypothetical protein